MAIFSYYEAAQNIICILAEAYKLSQPFALEKPELLVLIQNVVYWLLEVEMQYSRDIWILSSKTLYWYLVTKGCMGNSVKDISHILEHK